jgi:YHS domain-containing protein
LKQVLVPGNPEFQCKYREKIYRFSSEENRALFMENPVKYLPAKKNPEVDYFNQKI